MGSCGYIRTIGQNGKFKHNEIFVLNFIQFSALFRLFFIGWSINHVLYLNVT